MALSLVWRDVRKEQAGELAAGFVALYLPRKGFRWTRNPLRVPFEPASRKPLLAVPGAHQVHFGTPPTRDAKRCSLNMASGSGNAGARFCLPPPLEGVIRIDPIESRGPTNRSGQP
jgi:hypothetical protein